MAYKKNFKNKKRKFNNGEYDDRQNYKNNNKSPRSLETGRYAGNDSNQDVEFNYSKRTGRTGPNEGSSRRRVSDSGKPEPEANKSETYFQFQKKYFRELSYPKTIQVAPDPNSEVTRMADPYAVINKTNLIFDAKYPEKENTSGNVIMQLPNGSNSTMQQVADALELKMKINYNYAKLTEESKAPKAVNDQIQNVWLEVQSTFESQAFYELPFFGWSCTSGSKQFSDGLLDIVHYYQVFLQSGLTVPQTYRKIMSLEKELKDMTFYKGSAIVGSIYALLKKSSFRGTVDQVGKSMGSNFIDEAWIDQMATLYLTPSRKSASMIDPLVNARIEYYHNDDLTVVDAQGQEIIKTSGLADFFTYVDTFNDTLTCSEILRMARTGASQKEVLNWFNKLVDQMSAMVNSINRFNDLFADMNTAFNRMHQVGFTTWSKGIFIDIENINFNFAPQYNLMLDDLLRSIFSGSTEITYDSAIHNWKLYELNDIYLGIPRYSRKVGGAFLTFSSKSVNAKNAPLNILYPVLFGFKEASLLRRDGAVINILQASITIDDSPELSRLISLGSMDKVKFNLPSFDSTKITSTKGKAWLNYALMKLIGYYENKVSALKNIYGVDPDKLYMVDIVQEDITAQMLNYIRLTSPFRVIKPNMKQEIGYII